MSAPGVNLKLNGDRLWETLMEMAKVGPGIAGGLRSAGTQAVLQGFRQLPPVSQEGYPQG